MGKRDKNLDKKKQSNKPIRKRQQQDVVETKSDSGNAEAIRGLSVKFATYGIHICKDIFTNKYNPPLHLLEYFVNIPCTLCYVQDEARHIFKGICKVPSCPKLLFEDIDSIRNAFGRPVNVRLKESRTPQDLTVSAAYNFFIGLEHSCPIRIKPYVVAPSVTVLYYAYKLRNSDPDLYTMIKDRNIIIDMSVMFKFINQHICKIDLIGEKILTRQIKQTNREQLVGLLDQASEFLNFTDEEEPMMGYWFKAHLSDALVLPNIDYEVFFTRTGIPIYVRGGQFGTAEELNALTISIKDNHETSPLQHDTHEERPHSPALSHNSSVDEDKDRVIDNQPVHKKVSQSSGRSHEKNYDR